MSENRKFRLRYDELRENDPGHKSAHEKKNSQDQNTDSEDITYAHVGNTRNLGVEWPDGRRMFFNYAYLISTELSISDDVNIITLAFTSHVVTLKGYKLDILYEELFTQRSRILSVTNERYGSSSDEESYSITELEVNPAAG